MNRFREQIEQVSSTHINIMGRIIKAHNIDLSFIQGEPKFSNTYGSFVIIASEARADEVVIFDNGIGIVTLDRSSGTMVDSWEDFFKDCEARGYVF